MLVVTTPTPPKAARADDFDAVLDRLSPIERFNVRFVRRSFDIRPFDRAMRWCQEHIGARWIRAVTGNLVQISGLDRIPPPVPGQSIIWASNHRTFFDMYVANAILFAHGYKERVLYPVRSTFFYDTVPGFFVNGVMSFWSMYPPVFRDRKRASINHTAFSELSRAVARGRSVGIHPEGARNHGDPYQLLPAQSGIGRLIHLAKVPVVPFFINGLTNDIGEQIVSNFSGRGPKVHLVFGPTVELGGLLDAPGTGKVYREIAERVTADIAKLGEEERALRSAQGDVQSSAT